MRSNVWSSNSKIGQCIVVTEEINPELWGGFFYKLLVTFKCKGQTSVSRLPEQGDSTVLFSNEMKYVIDSSGFFTMFVKIFFDKIDTIIINILGKLKHITTNYKTKT